MATDVAGRWLTTKEAAALLRVHPKHMYRLLKQGLPASRVGGQWRFQSAELASWSRGGRRAGNEEKQIATQGLPGFLGTDDDVAVDLLLSLLHRDRAPLLGRVSRNRRTPLEPLLDGSVLAVAVLGDLPDPPSIALARIHLAHVQLGLAACPGGPVPSLALLSTKRLRLASWTSGSDPRSILEGVLEREGIDPVRVHSRALEFLSHADAIAAVVARRADLAWTSAAWADRFALPFLPLASRSLALVARADSLGNPSLIRCWQVLQSEAFREAIRSLPGYDAEGSGEIRYLSGAGDSFPVARKPLLRASPHSQPDAARTRPPIRCAIVTRGHGQDASPRILRLVRALVARGIGVCGCVQLPHKTQGKLAGYDLTRIGKAGTHALARRSASSREGFAAFRFDNEAFTTARAWIEKERSDARVCVIDSWGALESKGTGHFDAIASALRTREHGLVLASARRDVLPDILRRLDVPERAVLRLDLPCDARAEKRFLDAIVRVAGG